MTADGCAIRLDGSEIENDRSAGNTRQAMVRCEAIDVCPADTLPEQDQNLLKGTVVSVQFLGAHFEYVIEVNGVRLHALAANEFSMGAGVCVLFHSKDIHLFPDTTNLD